MKIILLIICWVTLLASTGCVFWRGQDHAEVRERRPPAMGDEHSVGVDHGEHPGDMDHDANR
jgi:flagellar basal body-associated protein FliL